MKIALPLFCLAGFAAPAVQAQEAPREGAANDIVITGQQAQKQVTSDATLGALGDRTALETPFNVTTYTAQLVLDQQAETLGEVLENDPSVRTTYGFGNQSELFVIRGFPLYGDDVAIDGLYGVTPRQIVSPELFERIQVLNGANAFLFGAAPGGSGLGGGINLTPKRAERTLLRATANYTGDNVWGGNIDVGTRFGADDAFGIRVNGVYRDGETAITDEKRSARVIGANFDFRRGPGRFFLDFGYEDQRAYQPRPEVSVAAGQAVPRVPGASDNYAQPWSYTRLRDIYALARAEVDLAPGWMAYMAAGLRDGHEEGDYATLTVTNAATGAGTQSRLYVPRNDNNESGQIGLRGKFSVGGISNELSLGGSINFQENRNAYAFGAFTPANGGTNPTGTSFNISTNLYAPRLVARPADGLAAGSFTNPPRVSATEFGSLFISDTIGLFDDHLLVTGGVRQQSLDVRTFDRTTPDRDRYHESATTPVVGVIIRPTRTFSLYGNRIEGLVQGPTAPLTANTLNQGEVFAPYRTTQYEVGGKIEVRRLTATLAFYQTRQPNAFNKPTPTAGNANATTYVIEGEQRNRGIELGLNGEPTDWLRIIGGASINDATQTRTLNGANDGKSAVGVPGYQINLGAEVVPPFLRAATLTGRFVRTGHQYLDVANLQRVDDWTRFDLGLRYILVADQHPITLRVSAENIDNRRYWYSAFGGYLVQGSPRTVKASATFEF